MIDGCHQGTMGVIAVLMLLACPGKKFIKDWLFLNGNIGQLEFSYSSLYYPKPSLANSIPKKAV
jgi:hypothetical protein